MSDLLLPCPFCGKDAHMVTDSGPPSRLFTAQCRFCGASRGGHPDREIAAELWNRRAAAAPPPEPECICKPGDWRDGYYDRECPRHGDAAPPPDRNDLLAVGRAQSQHDAESRASLSTPVPSTTKSDTSWRNGDCAMKPYNGDCHSTWCRRAGRCCANEKGPS